MSFFVAVIKIDKLLGRGSIGERRNLPFSSNYLPAQPPYDTYKPSFLS